MRHVSFTFIIILSATFHFYIHHYFKCDFLLLHSLLVQVRPFTNFTNLHTNFKIHLGHRNMTIRTFLDFFSFLISGVCVAIFLSFLGPASFRRFGGNYYISTLQEAGVTPRRARTHRFICLAFVLGPNATMDHGHTRTKFHDANTLLCPPLSVRERRTFATTQVV